VHGCAESAISTTSDFLQGQLTKELETTLAHLAKKMGMILLVTISVSESLRSISPSSTNIASYAVVIALTDWSSKAMPCNMR
jgi:hypothetical protein